MKSLDVIAELLFPRKCVLCRRLLEKDETDLCRNCRVEAPECSGFSSKFSFLDSWTAVWYYEDPVRESILRYKFGGARHYADCYGKLLAMKLQERHPDGFDCLTWVPISRLRKFRRGYDQVELLARAVGRELGIKPVRLLKKIADTIHKVNPAVEVIMNTYNWGWSPLEVRKKFLEQMPKDVTLHVTYDIFKISHHDGLSCPTMDYSISAADPGYYFTSEVETGHELGIERIRVQRVWF